MSPDSVTVTFEVSEAEEDCINNIYDKVLAGFSWHINYFQRILSNFC